MSAHTTLAVCGLSAFLVAGGGAVAAPEPAPVATDLAPHRAIYDLELVKARTSSGVAALKGRLVFEFNGSVCEGFSQNLRFVMSITDRDGGARVSDLRSSTWENSDGGRFKFSVNDFQNEEPGDAASGNAVRKAADGAIDVDLAKPRQTKVALDSGTLFPVQHTIALLDAAEHGGHFLAAKLYDGSDTGEKVFFTSSVIGNVQTGGLGPDLSAIKNADRLRGLRYWPISIAYFDPGSAEHEGVPSHEMAFHVYENGVVRDLFIDYGSLSVKGTLAEIQFYEAPKCP